MFDKKKNQNAFWCTIKKLISKPGVSYLRVPIWIDKDQGWPRTSYSIYMPCPFSFLQGRFTVERNPLFFAFERQFVKEKSN